MSDTDLRLRAAARHTDRRRAFARGRLFVDM